MISKRPAIETDKPFLVWLEEACMREYAVALWGSWSPHLNARNSIDDCQIIANDGHDVGCVTVEKHSDHLWLDELFIEPAFQRRGIGSKILWSVIADAEGLETPLRLSVLTTNPALDFYLRHGFRIHQETAERQYLVRQCDPAAIRVVTQL
ncbi:hypothetical protein ASC97_01575 [Rhizobium sp. Root1203]|uniref:GNAT family N-acetyltransferase n=1 Tax=Rhizobium sp. Root1203 TaxID=1736427 RepID=UPI00070B8310|nr:GNAT family N-acetyltransferase [Rhizobium sp. Root1203]KQV32312.1 hypothetical protein ASC97_01575 [Rhizobium sp. Root1203]